MYRRGRIQRVQMMAKNIRNPSVVHVDEAEFSRLTEQLVNGLLV